MHGITKKIDYIINAIRRYSEQKNDIKTKPRLIQLVAYRLGNATISNVICLVNPLPFTIRKWIV